jgi:L-seryl-tRNA(Ser) seleniumtransferase
VSKPITALRDLPRVDTLAGQVDSFDLPGALAVDLARTGLEIARSQIGSGRPADVEQIVKDLVEATRLSRTRRVINATGVLLHTNLGRAPLSEAALEAIRVAATGYTNLELDLGQGVRGGRGSYVRLLLRSLTGADDALVVNNNAAALLLALAATSAGKAVLVARGELIEIGGSYRLPEVMGISGASLVEVGTTNRTRIGDYETAIQLYETGSILKVHPSNYRVEGFTEEASLGDLADLAHAHDVPVIHDAGSGLLDKTARWLERPPPAWMLDEPAARESLEAGADIVTFSGDKLLGGPQAGIAVGSSGLLGLMRRHPLARALRIDGITEAALEATLGCYAREAVDDIPFWRMTRIPHTEIGARLEMLRSQIGGSVVNGESLIGAGSVPGVGIETPQLVLQGEDHLYHRLLRTEQPVAARRMGGDLLIDLRAADPDDDLVIAEMVTRCR